jgi:hypothetical protein
VIDFIALEQLVRGPLKNAPEFQVNGHSVIDPTQVYYLGGSLGGIMGNTFMAYDPNILRGGLGVPGGIWSMMFERSQAWSLLQGPAESSYPDFYEAQNLIALLGMRMEPVDPVTTATHVLADPLPNTPVKQLDLYETLGDCLVTNLSTETMARTMKLKAIGPSLKQPWGLEVTTDPQPNALTIYDEHRCRRRPTCRPRPTTARTPASTSAPRCCARSTTSSSAARSRISACRAARRRRAIARPASATELRDDRTSDLPRRGLRNPARSEVRGPTSRAELARRARREGVDRALRRAEAQRLERVDRGRQRLAA